MMHGEEGWHDDDDDDDDIENLGSQNPCQVLGGRPSREKTHVLVVKHCQPAAYGSDDYEIDVHPLHLLPGENALILKGKTEPSVLMDSHSVRSFKQNGGPIIVDSEQYLYFDVTSKNIVTIKDYRTPPSADSTSTTTSLENKVPMVGVASKTRPSQVEELPFRQLRVLQPGDRIITNMAADRAGGGFIILEYRFENDDDFVTSTSSAPSESESCEEQEEIDQCSLPSNYPDLKAPRLSPPAASRWSSIGSPPPRRCPVELACASLLLPPANRQQPKVTIHNDEDKDDFVKSISTPSESGSHEEQEEIELCLLVSNDQTITAPPSSPYPAMPCPDPQTLPLTHLAGNGKGEDDDLVTSPTTTPGASSRGSQSLHGLGFLSPSQIHSIKAHDMLSPPGAVAFLSGSQPCEMEEAEDFVSAAGDIEGPQSLGSSDINNRAQNVDDAEEENPQPLHTSCRHLLASPSQGRDRSWMRGIGIETQDTDTTTMDVRLHISAVTRTDVVRGIDTLITGLQQNSLALIADAGQSFSGLISDFITFWNVQEAQLPPDESGSSPGVAWKAVEPETTPAQPWQGVVLPGSPACEMEEAEDYVPRAKDEIISISLPGPTPAHSRSSKKQKRAEAIIEARRQMAQDKDKVQENRRKNKALKALREKAEAKDFVPRAKEEVISISLSDPTPAHSRSSKKQKKAEAIVEARRQIAQDKENVQENRRTTKEALRERESLSTGALPPFPSSITQKSLKGVSLLEEQEKIKQISIIGTQAALDQKMIEKLGGILYENLPDAWKATHLIFDVDDDGNPNLIRTPKFMIAVAQGCDLVHINFYKDSITSNKFLDGEDYLLWKMRDKKVKKALGAFERKYKFSLFQSITRARELRMRNLLLLSGIRVYICKGVAGKKGRNHATPILSEFRAILEGAGATVIRALPDSLEGIPKTFIITSHLKNEAAKQKATLGPLQAGYAVAFFTATEIFTAITQQTLPLRVTTEAE